MAFSFGAAAPAASPFGGGGLFGAPAAPAASSAPATGSAFSFGASSTPAFGTTATPAFGAPAAASAPAASPFGAAPAAPATNPFSAPASAPTLGATTGTGLFGQPASAPATSNALVPAGTGLFGAPAAQPAQPQAQAASQARPGGLNYKTKFEELPPQMQQELQKIQQEISAYRDECKALEADSRLHDTVSIKQSLDSETAALRQTLQSLHQAAVAEDEALMGFRERVMVLLRSTESAIRLYQRSKLWRELSAAAGQLPGGAGGGAGGAGAGGGGGSQLLASQAVADQISQPVQLPNPYLGLAVRGFSEALEQYHRCISELERVMTAAGGAVGAGGGLMGAGGAGGAGDDAAAVAALPTLVSHMHDYFVHVAARLERLHGEVGRAREAYLAARRARGDFGDPFADARPLHHMSKSGVNPKSAHSGGGANNGGGTFYSFGGPATAAGNGAGGLGGVGGLGGAGGMGAAPGTPGAAGTGVGGGAGTSGGGLFGMSPGPLGGAGASPFGAAGVGAGAFGTPLLGAASAQQPQQQRVSAGRAGSSSNKKR